MLKDTYNDQTNIEFSGSSEWGNWQMDLNGQLPKYWVPVGLRELALAVARAPQKATMCRER